MNSEKFSDEVKVSEIRTCNLKDKLVAIILDQQFDYWYDPCGKSGYELNDSLTERSRWAMKRLNDIVWNGAGDDHVDTSQPGAVEVEDLAIINVVHRLWSKYAGTANYDKESEKPLWMVLQNFVERHGGVSAKSSDYGGKK